MLNITYLRELCEKATKGPWWKRSHIRYAINSIDRHVAMVSCMERISGDAAENDANADFIAASREALPELLDRVEALERVAEAAKRLREVQRMHRVPRQANEGEALLELDNALRDAGEGGI